MKSLSCVRLFVTPWTVACQAPLSMGFSRQEYWSGLPFPSPGDLPNPGIEPGSPALQAGALSSEPPGNPNRNLKDHKIEETVVYQDIRGRTEDGWGIGQGDHFLPHKFIKITFERWVNSTKQLLNASRGHQAPRKAGHCLQKEVGKNINNKKRDKRGRNGAPSREGSLKKERSFQTPGNTLSLPSLWQALEPQRAT